MHDGSQDGSLLTCKFRVFSGAHFQKARRKIVIQVPHHTQMLLSVLGTPLQGSPQVLKEQTLQN